MPTAVTACPAGWTAAPNASWSAACYGVLEEHTSSLRECVEACGHHEAVPVCVGSEEENAFAVALVGDDGISWLGLYQSDTSGGAGEGWARCVGGAAPGFSNWADGEPNDWDGQPEDCAFVTGQGEWYDLPCDVDDWSLRCACAGPANASASFAQDLDELEAALEEEEAAERATARVTVAIGLSVAAIVALVPSLMFLCHLARANLRRRRSTAADGGGGEQTSSTEAEASHSATVRSLRAARRSAAQRRLQVSGAMMQAGWALVVLGLAPLFIEISAFHIGLSDELILLGPFTYYLLLVPLGLYLLLLALLPTDARAIRVVCAVVFALWLFGGVGFSYVSGDLASTYATERQEGEFQDALGLYLPTAVVFLAAAAGVGPTLPCHSCRCVRVMEPRQALRRLWLVLRLFSAGLGVLFVSYFTVILATEENTEDDPNNPGTLACGATLLLCAALATPANRAVIHVQQQLLSAEQPALPLSELSAALRPFSSTQAPNSPPSPFNTPECC